MATPICAGIAALVRMYYPALTAAQVKDILMQTVTPCEQECKFFRKTVSFKNLSISGGMLNGYEAMKLAEKIASSDVKNYKTTIKNYLKAVVDYTYTLNKNIGFWENQYYCTVETINEKLESLANELLSEEKENLDISSTIDIIQGLLIDIYK